MLVLVGDCETYLSGIDLLTAEGVVVGTHGGGFACSTGVVESGQLSMSFLTAVTNLAKGGSSASCDFNDTG